MFHSIITRNYMQKQFNRRCMKNSTKISTNSIKKIDYISDVHIDTQDEGNIPEITNINSSLCIVAGDIGDPNHINFTLFLDKISRKYEDVFFIPGNHDFNIGYNRKI